MNSASDSRPVSVAAPHLPRAARSAKQDILHRLRRRPQQSAQQLAEAIDASVQGVRRHLRDLETEGLVEFEAVQAGMGRPQHLYRLTGKALEQFPKQYDEFAVTFLTAMADRVGPEQMEQVLHAQWHQKALSYRDRIGQGSLAERVATLADLRTQEGYMVDWYRVESADAVTGEDSESYVFAEYNCAISQVAETFPTVCSHELEMLQAVFADCTVTRTHWMVGNDRRCGYEIGMRDR